MKQPPNVAEFQERLARKVAESKADLSGWVQHHTEDGRAPTAIALLETAIELFISDLGERDASQFVQTIFARVAAQHRTQSNAMRAGLASVAKMDTKGEA